MEQLREANKEVRRCKTAAAGPYAPHETLWAYNRALGVQQGVGRCLDALDRTIELRESFANIDEHRAALEAELAGRDT